MESSVDARIAFPSRVWWTEVMDSVHIEICLESVFCRGRGEGREGAREGQGFLTANNVCVYLPHSHIVKSQRPIYAARHNLVPEHVQTTHAIPALLQHLDRLGCLALGIPDPNCRVEASCTSPSINISAPPLGSPNIKKVSRSIPSNLPLTTKLSPSPPNPTQLTRPKWPVHLLSVRAVATSQ